MMRGEYRSGGGAGRACAAVGRRHVLSPREARCLQQPTHRTATHAAAATAATAADAVGPVAVGLAATAARVVAALAVLGSLVEQRLEAASGQVGV